MCSMHGVRDSRTIRQGDKGPKAATEYRQIGGFLRKTTEIEHLAR